eukprot:6213990-Pleurochrysis_carterae.AAC.3
MQNGGASHSMRTARRSEGRGNGGTVSSLAVSGVEKLRGERMRHHLIVLGKEDEEVACRGRQRAGRLKAGRASRPIRETLTTVLDPFWSKVLETRDTYSDAHLVLCVRERSKWEHRALARRHALVKGRQQICMRGRPLAPRSCRTKPLDADAKTDIKRIATYTHQRITAQTRIRMHAHTLVLAHLQ